jgi:hypothetical protein
MKPLEFFRNRSESFVLIVAFPPNACRGERCGVWGRRAPHQIGSGHDGKSFVRLTRFPECEQKHGELSGHSDYGSLLGPGGAILGEP